MTSSSRSSQRGRAGAGTRRARAEARNDASTLGEWLLEEAAWLVAQFLKVAVSVAAFRGIHQLFRSRLANESAYRRAPDLWSHGYQEPEGRPENGSRPEWTRSATGPFADRPRAYSSTGNNSADDVASDAPKYISLDRGTSPLPPRPAAASRAAVALPDLGPDAVPDVLFPRVRRRRDGSVRGASGR